MRCLNIIYQTVFLSISPNRYGCKMYIYLLTLLSPSFSTDYLHDFYYTIDPLYPRIAHLWIQLAMEETLCLYGTSADIFPYNYSLNNNE